MIGFLTAGTHTVLAEGSCTGTALVLSAETLPSAVAWGVPLCVLTGDPTAVQSDTVGGTPCTSLAPSGVMGLASDIAHLGKTAGRPSSNVKIICSVNLQNMLLVYTECWLK